MAHVTFVVVMGVAVVTETFCLAHVFQALWHAVYCCIYDLLWDLMPKLPGLSNQSIFGRRSRVKFGELALENSPAVLDWIEIWQRRGGDQGT